VSHLAMRVGTSILEHRGDKDQDRYDGGRDRTCLKCALWAVQQWNRSRLPIKNLDMNEPNEPAVACDTLITPTW
jgi:hypothetical protein